MSKITYFAVFTAGAAVGAAAVWNFAHRQAEERCNEEIRSVKEAFSVKYRVEKDKEIMQAACKGFADGIDIADNTPVDASGGDAPYVISPDDFGEDEDYDTISLIYYSDDILADTDGEVVDDIIGTVGKEALRILKNTPVDSVTVRNTKRKCDYEILFDNAPYSDEE